AEYTARFPNSCAIEGSWQGLRIYDMESAQSQITAKLNKVAEMTQARAQNLYTLASLTGPAISTTLLLNIDALPFHNRLKHFAPNIQNICPLCSNGPFEANHLFNCSK